MSKLPKQPFQSIALCMSGGGYRAASFHLGAMSYLEHMDLLKNVVAISTVSGGTITGVMYALYKSKGESFSQIYARLIHQLQTRDLIKEGIAKLKLDGEWYNPFKRRNLINALSEIYDQHFTDGATYKAILGDEENPLKLMVFNATEFNHGINFRFQNQGLMGNKYVKVPKAVREEIKLADVIAASSCFPGGFEPIGFPGDFLHDESTGLHELKQEKYSDDVGLMDGGIYDNQGIDAILLSEKRNKKVHDLIIISDVSSPDMADFRFHSNIEQDGFRNLNLKKLYQRVVKFNSGVIIFIVGLVLFSVLVAGLAGFANNIGTGIGIALISVAFVALFIYLDIRRRIRKVVNAVIKLVKGEVPEFYLNHLTKLDLADYKMGEYEPLIIDRLKSLSKLLQDVFLKQIRRLNYAKVYQSDDHDYRRISNLSKELTEVNLKKSIAKFQNLSSCPKEMKKPYDELLGDQLPGIINEAASFGTNLWFTDKDKLNETLKKLLVSGQFNMCFNLLVYALELEASWDFGKYPEDIQQKIKDLRVHLVKDWNKFVEQPDFMI